MGQIETSSSAECRNYAELIAEEISEMANAPISKMSKEERDILLSELIRNTLKKYLEKVPLNMRNEVEERLYEELAEISGNEDTKIYLYMHVSLVRTALLIGALDDALERLGEPKRVLH